MTKLEKLIAELCPEGVTHYSCFAQITVSIAEFSKNIYKFEGGMKNDY